MMQVMLSMVIVRRPLKSFAKCTMDIAGYMHLECMCLAQQHWSAAGVHAHIIDTGYPI